jgi:hypothetical protein
LFYNAYEKTNITHVNTFEELFAQEKYCNDLFEGLDLYPEIMAGNQISINISDGAVEFLSEKSNKRNLSKKFIHYFSIKSSIREIHEFLEK